MNTLADKTQENKNQPVANGGSQMRSSGDFTFQFEDNRPEAIAQRKLQQLANNSLQVLQQRAFQNMTNNSPRAQQATQLAAMANNHALQQPIQTKENNTGLPDNLKTGVENLSGISLDDVKVHRNSDKPAQLNAHAYAQGTDIHLVGQEKHLPHETWHVVHQKQRRVQPTMQMKGKGDVNDDVALEKEVEVMGQNALSSSSINSSIKTQLRTINQPIVQAVHVPDYPSEDFLIARLRGIDSILGINNGNKTEVVLEELEKLTTQIETKNWFRAVAVIVALESKWNIDEFPPPLVPGEAFPLVNGKALLKEGGIIPLHEKPQAPLEIGAGTKMIELGAGNMASASSSWMDTHHTAFTEFRSKEELQTDYGSKFSDNVDKIKKDDPENRQVNKLAFGIDATKEGAFEDLPLTETLRFTNPNIGHQDIAEAISPMISEALDEEEDGNYRVYSSMGLSFKLDMDRAVQYKGSTQKITWLQTLITSTANSISVCRNVNMMFSFMQNAPAKLIPGSGVVEIIVSKSYLDRWPLISMATDMNYKVTVKPHELGFDNIKTQESSNVSSKKPPEKVLITLTPPWGGGIKIQDVLEYCQEQTIYTQSQPTILSRVWKT